MLNLNRPQITGGGFFICMKKLIVFILLLACRLAAAQTEGLATAENGKYVVYQVDELPGAPAKTLFERCLAGLKKNYKGKNFQLTPYPDTLVAVKGKIMVYTSQSAVRREDGDVAFTLRVEFKEGRYRYLFTDFIFSPYQRNRYGTFEPAPGKDMTLEEANEKIGKKRFDEYADQILKYCRQLGSNLKVYAAGPQKSAENKKRVDTKNW